MTSFEKNSAFVVGPEHRRGAANTSLTAIVQETDGDHPAQHGGCDFGYRMRGQTS
jgi:hypothetical protein